MLLVIEDRVFTIFLKPIGDVCYKNENESKGKKELWDWVDSSCVSADKAKFLEDHLIPNVDLTLANFDEFITERKKLLKTKLLGILV